MFSGQAADQALQFQVHQDHGELVADLFAVEIVFFDELIEGEAAGMAYALVNGSGGAGRGARGG